MEFKCCILRNEWKQAMKNKKIQAKHVFMQTIKIKEKNSEANNKSSCLLTP